MKGIKFLLVDSLKELKSMHESASRGFGILFSAAANPSGDPLGAAAGIPGTVLGPCLA